MFVPSGITLPFHQRTFTESPHNDYEMRTTINDWLEMTFTHIVTHTPQDTGLLKHQSLFCYKQV